MMMASSEGPMFPSPASSDHGVPMARSTAMTATITTAMTAADARCLKRLSSWTSIRMNLSLRWLLREMFWPQLGQKRASRPTSLPQLGHLVVRSVYSDVPVLDDDIL